MAIYAVIASTNPELLKAAVVTQYGASHYEFAPNVWFVSDTGSSKDVAEKLGITDGSVGASGVVLRFDAYSGRASVAGWTWLRQFPETVSNG